ncbi:MAG TPA: cysteine desulfuration protein SufE [Myxococcales bacterium]|nr:cysteine desulfuration protein SufE [Deltaproteobacteria bacterium]HAA54104.1 cysteine desulfuration protein SufE [Myxococcales bacterium]|tara:strand:- start:14244 stop:14663 length:420 start_codon:yes stop_codon:yes gene_type:complete
MTEVLPTSLQSQLALLSDAPDRRQKLLTLIQQADTLPPIPPSFETSAELVPGCTVKVRLDAYIEDGKIYYVGDADAKLIRGVLALLIKGMSGLTPEEIASIPPDFISTLGVQQSVMPGRTNSLFNIFRRMQALATQHTT